jgi:predicted MFS family arabinose efflux permease
VLTNSKQPGCEIWAEEKSLTVNGGSAEQRSDLEARSHTALVALLCATSFALGLNDAFLNPILPDMARGLGVSIAVAGQLATITLLVGAVVPLVLGVLSDLFGRRWFLLAGLAVAGLANLGLGLAPTFAWALAGRFLAGFGLVFAIILAVFGDRYLGTARDSMTARVLQAYSLGAVVGAPGITAVAGVFGWRLGVGALGILLIAVAVVGLGVFPEQSRPVLSGKTVEALREIWESHWGRPGLWLALVTAASRGAYWTAYLTFAGAWLHDSFNLPTWQIGPVYTLNTVAWMAGIEVGTRWADRSGPKAVIVWANVGAGVLVLLLPQTPWLVPSVIGFAVASLLVGAGGSTLLALTLRLAPASRGATMALGNGLTGVGGAVGVVISGLAISAIGYPGLGFASGALALVTVALALLIAAGHQTGSLARNDQAGARG